MNNKILAKLLKDFGEASVVKASDPVVNHVDFIPFPSYTMGDAAHIWGWPRGRISQVHGLPGSGKTFYALLSVKQAQMADPESIQVWVDTEFQFNTKWAETLGIDVERLMIIQENDGAKVFSRLFGRVNDKGAKNKLGVVDYIKSGELDCNFIVLDSIANIVPPVEKGRNFEDQNIAALARFLPGAFNRAAADISGTKAAMLCINQARVDMASRFGGITYPGGFKYKHILSLAVRLNASMAKDSTLFDADGRKIGHKVLMTVEKTRFGPDKYKGDFMVNFFKGVVNLGYEVAQLGAAYDVVKRPNITKWEYKEASVTGKDNFFKLLEDDSELRNRILAEVKEVKEAGATRGYLLSDEAEHDGLEDKYSDSE
jgi:recombination protein RecA